MTVFRIALANLRYPPWSSVAAAARHAGIAVILGTERLVDGGLRISTAVIDRDGTIAGFQDKVQLDPSEEGIYHPGSERRVFRAGSLTFGIAMPPRTRAILRP